MYLNTLDSLTGMSEGSGILCVARLISHVWQW